MFKAPVLSPERQSSGRTAFAIYQSVYQSPCSPFRHLWIPPQYLNYCNALPFTVHTNSNFCKNIWSWSKFHSGLIAGNCKLTNQVHVEELRSENASTAKSSTKCKRSILQPLTATLVDTTATVYSINMQ